jgi:endonuclease/exonuclease/phosphatase (EEP) superfamily protein YafD
MAAWPLLDRRAASWVLLAGLVAALGLQLRWLWPYTTLHPIQALPAGDCAPDRRLSVVVANLRTSNQGAGRFLDEVRRTDPDMVFIVEVDHGWVRALQPLEAAYPHHVLHPRADFWGLALYTRLEMVEPGIRHLVSGYVPSLRTGLRLRSGAVVAFHGLHPKPPMPREGTGQRDAELLLAAEAVRGGGAALIGGDLNAVAWSPVTWLMQRVGGLLDPRIGRGIFATFPTWLPGPLRFPIDHVFFTPEFRLLGVERLPDIGSDHLPLLVRLCHRPEAAAEARERVPQAGEADLRRAREMIRDGREDTGEVRPPD